MDEESTELWKWLSSQESRNVEISLHVVVPYWVNTFEDLLKLIWRNHVGDGVCNIIFLGKPNAQLFPVKDKTFGERVRVSDFYIEIEDRLSCMFSILPYIDNDYYTYDIIIQIAKNLFRQAKAWLNKVLSIKECPILSEEDWEELKQDTKESSIWCVSEEEYMEALVSILMEVVEGFPNGFIYIYEMAWVLFPSIAAALDNTICYIPCTPSYFAYAHIEADLFSKSYQVFLIEDLREALALCFEKGKPKEYTFSYLSHFYEGHGYISDMCIILAQLIWGFSKTLTCQGIQLEIPGWSSTADRNGKPDLHFYIDYTDTSSPKLQIFNLADRSLIEENPLDFWEKVLKALTGVYTLKDDWWIMED